MARTGAQANGTDRAARRTRRANHAIPVLIALPHGVVRESVRCFLDCQPDLRVVDMVADGPAAVREAQQARPRVVVLDIALKGMNGIEATRTLRERAPAVGVVILCSCATPLLVRQARAAGASAVLPEGATGQAFLDALREAAATRSPGSAQAAGRRVAAQRRVRHDSPGVEPLTENERHIMRLAANGYTNGGIARTLGLSPRTVETYRLRLMHKLGLAHFAALVKYAIRHAFTTLE